ncbi:RelA/SpoT family protein [bacterium]|nr:RelA/SpoT family protein [bacterium]
MDAKQELIEKVIAYNPQADTALLAKAYDIAKDAHSHQMRASGDPYFMHPLAVANILTEMKLDTASVITGILHDTVEDTNLTIDDIRKEFGEEIASLVDGVTKLSKLEHKSETLRQAENFRKLVMAISEDIRVLLVKLADRLHNMRTLHYIKSPDKRKRISYETLEIYATLAERIGMRRLKDELQDIAFAELHPEARTSIINRLGFLRSEGQPLVEAILEEIGEVLKKNDIRGKFYGREKRPFSIWKKMESKNISFEQLSDIMAFRVMADDVGECYKALGVVHAHYHMIPGRFKDYISTPKPNGYQSIHTTVMGPKNQRVEIQIRTQDMQDQAEYGVAAHWSYKQNADFRMNGKQYRWVRELLEILEETSDPEDVLEHTRLEMYHDQVFCFTPKGDLIALPKHATPVDFAFAVHSAVGNTCVGAKVNGRIVPLRYQLQNGDQVDIIRSKTATPSPAWERFVVTGKARAEVRKFVRAQQRTEYINLGRAILSKYFRTEGYEYQDKLVEPALKILARDSVDDVLAEVGEGNLNRGQVLEAVFPGHAQRKTKAQEENKPSLISRFRKQGDEKPKGGHAVPIRGLIPGMAMHFAKCCHPIPGDKIVGIVTTGKGVTIHTIDCETLENYADQPERWLDVAWEGDNQEAALQHVSRIRALVSHETGALATISNVIAQDLGNINNLKIANRSSEFFELLIDIEVKDVRHLNNIIASLRAKPVVQSVERFQA